MKTIEERRRDSAAGEERRKQRLAQETRKAEEIQNKLFCRRMDLQSALEEMTTVTFDGDTLRKAILFIFENWPE